MPTDTKGTKPRSWFDRWLQGEREEREALTSSMAISIEHEKTNLKISDEPVDLPVNIAIFPLRASVLFPGAIVPIDVERPKSIKLIDDAIKNEQPLVAILTQKDTTNEDPGPDALYRIGCVARILKVIRKDNTDYSITVQGLCRTRILEFVQSQPYLKGRVEALPDPGSKKLQIIDGLAELAITLKDTCKHVISRMPELPKEATSLVESVQDPCQLSDLITSQLDIPVEEKQNILETFDVKDRTYKVLELMTRQREVLNIREKINTQVQEEIGRNQREYVLRQQLKAINEELGERDLDRLRKRLSSVHLPGNVHAIAKQELDRLGHLASQTHEYDTLYRYVDWLLSLPWEPVELPYIDPRRAEDTLNAVHHGAHAVKEWLVEELAVTRLAKTSPSHALCFVGPPGVGKTTLGQAIAKALQREFVSVSLGGAHDESVIRGISRFYIGATPGALARALRTANTSNPVILLDEIDKLMPGEHGDPRAALLEALDSARNYRLFDNYLQAYIDLSQVLFIATANSATDIYPPLRSRLRILEFWGYDFYEKLSIATTHIWPKCLESHGLKPDQLRISEDALRYLIRRYTREAGVRDLEQRLNAICRQVAKKIAEARERGIQHVVDLKESRLASYLGDALFFPYLESREAQVGRVNVAGITQHGAVIFPVDCVALEHLEPAMTVTGDGSAAARELCQMATTLVRKHRGRWLDSGPSYEPAFHLHLHGGLRSEEETWACGAALLVAMISAYGAQSVPQDLAVVGRITLLGEVQGVPNLHAKIMAAQRFGVRQMLLSRDNYNDVRSLPARIREDIAFDYISTVHELFTHSLCASSITTSELEARGADSEGRSEAVFSEST